MKISGKLPFVGADDEVEDGECVAREVAILGLFARAQVGKERGKVGWKLGRASGADFTRISETNFSVACLRVFSAGAGVVNF